MTIPPMEQIEKFQVLKLSPTLGLSYGIIRIHVACVKCPQTCPIGSKLFWKKNKHKKPPILISMGIVPKNTSM